MESAATEESENSEEAAAGIAPRKVGPRYKRVVVDGVRCVVIPEKEYLELLQGLRLGSHRLSDLRERGDLVRAARLKAGLTQDELAKLMKAHASAIANVENAKSAIGAQFIARVLDACGLPRDWQPSAMDKQRVKESRANPRPNPRRR